MKPPISKFTVHGKSMLPALADGQDVVSMNWFYKVKVGDIVVIKQDGREMIKRVREIVGERIWLEGDNTKESTDSRQFGPVSMNQVIGKVVLSFPVVGSHN